MNNKPKHTPGPWKFDVASGYIETSDGGLVAIPRSGGGLPGHFESDIHANADFIVKACNSHYEMLEALEFVMRCNPGAVYLNGVDGEMYGEWDLALKAINKAKGL